MGLAGVGGEASEPLRRRDAEGAGCGERVERCGLDPAQLIALAPGVDELGTQIVDALDDRGNLGASGLHGKEIL